MRAKHYLCKAVSKFSDEARTPYGTACVARLLLVDAGLSFETIGDFVAHSNA